MLEQPKQGLIRIKSENDVPVPLLTEGELDTLAEITSQIGQEFPDKDSESDGAEDKVYDEADQANDSS